MKGKRKMKMASTRIWGAGFLRGGAGSKGGVLKEGDVAVGHRMNVKAVKNKVAFPFREGIVDLYYATGFDKDEDLIQYALKIGVVVGSAWLSIVEDRKSTRLNSSHLGISYDV